MLKNFLFLIRICKKVKISVGPIFLSTESYWVKLSFFLKWAEKLFFFNSRIIKSQILFEYVLTPAQACSPLLRGAHLTLGQPGHQLIMSQKWHKNFRGSMTFGCSPLLRPAHPCSGLLRGAHLTLGQPGHQLIMSQKWHKNFRGQWPLAAHPCSGLLTPAQACSGVLTWP